MRLIWIAVAVGLFALVGVWLLGERGRLMRRSTLAMVRLSGLRRFLNLATAHGYVYARFTYPYVLVGSQYIAPLLGRRGKQWLANHYHGKVLTTELAQELVTVREDIPLRDLEHVVPFPIARDLVLAGPPDIAVYECPCRRLRDEPCEPTQVCMVIGQPFVDFMIEHHPRSARRLNQQEAVQLLQEEHERGHIHTAWFKDASAGRFYAICNCCSCCCGGIEAMRDRGIPMIVSSGFVACVDESQCSGCQACAKGCPFGALAIGEGTSPPRLDWTKCVGCGACEALCPTGAISLVRDEAKGPPLDVRALIGEGSSGAE